MSELVHAQVDEIVDTAIRFAEPLLRKYGCFAPFGLKMNGAGEISMNMFVDGEKRDSHSMLKFGEDAFRADADADADALAYALVCEGLMRDDDGSVIFPDTILIQIDHRSFPAVACHVPYSFGKRALFRKRELTVSTERRLKPGERIVFSDSRSEAGEP